MATADNYLATARATGGGNMAAGAVASLHAVGERKKPDATVKPLWLVTVRI